MAQVTVDGNETLRNVLADGHTDELRSLLFEMLLRVMESEVSEVCGASKGQHAKERVNTRNGYRERPFETRVGSMLLPIPKVRHGSYMPSFLDPRRRWERAFVNVVCEAYVKGVSTRKVEDLVESMGAKGMSKSEGSRMAKELDEMVRDFREQPLVGHFPYLWLDALYVKVREKSRVVSKAVLVAYGVDDTGVRRVLGVEVAAGEMEDSWRGFLYGLVNRGLSGVLLVISDAHTGLSKAIRAVFNGVSWQRCWVHFMRNVLTKVRKDAQGFVAATLRHVAAQPTQEEAREAMGKTIDLLTEKYPAAAEVVRGAEEDVLTYMAFPRKHWTKLRSTNPLERLNKEIRRRTDVVGIFPHDASTLRLIGALLMEQSDEWQVCRRYLSLESMAELKPMYPALKGAA